MVLHDSLSDAVNRRLQVEPADLVAIEGHEHSRVGRWFLLHGDYELIRRCPVPLLIVKRALRASRRPILAAVDPWHLNDKPADLDARILEAARALSHLLHAPLHSVHAYSPLAGFVADSTFAPVAIPIALPEEKAHAAAVRRRFKALSAGFRIAPRRAHLEIGTPRHVLPAVAARTRAQLVVMGALARGALDRLLLGSTAERVLDALPCDVLIVPPPRRRGRRGTRKAA